MNQPAKPVPIVVVNADQLEWLIQRAVAKAMSERGVAAPDDLLSATHAARLCRVRNGDLFAALEDGSLVGKRRGRRWVVDAAAAKAWARKRAT